MHASTRPTLLVIFGITGDLAQRKLLPSLYRVLCDGLLPAETKIIGVSRRDVTAASVVAGIRPHLADDTPDEAQLAALQDMISLFQLDLTDDEGYHKLLLHLQNIEKTYADGADRLYYLSIPPQVFLPVVRRLGEQGHSKSSKPNASVRLLVEKPFGYDLQSAEELITSMGKYFAEEQTYRIDHYLAKETAQNILTFRFQNPIFEAIWNAEHIERIEIIASEILGIEGRTAFYEQTGALRDLIQSHLLQLLALTTMERPAEMDSAAIHEARLALLRDITPIHPDQVAARTVRGQYMGYIDEVQNADSSIETFAAMWLDIANKRWAGMPILIKTGKKLDRKATEIHVCFKTLNVDDKPNRLIFRLQPNEGITLELEAKQPGFTAKMHPVDMKFDYQSAFTNRQPDAYERVLVDAFRGDRTLFASNDEILTSWRIVQPVLDEWVKNNVSLQAYEAGTSGPKIM